MMNKNFEIISYVGVGEIKFGMSMEQLKSIFNCPPEIEYYDPVMKVTKLTWYNINVRLNSKKEVEEISFSEGAFRPVYNNNDLLADPDLAKNLGKTEKPLNTVGFKVSFESGIAITGFSKKKDDKSVTVFAKQLIADWIS